MKIPVVALALVALSTAAGCSSNPKLPPDSVPPGGYAPPPLAVPTAPPPPPSGPCDGPQSLAMSAGMQARSAAEAPGMKPEGMVTCGVVAEGQTVVSQPFVLEQGYCYTFLGQSLPPVSSMEIEVQADPPSGGMIPPMVGQMMQQKLLVTTEPGERISIAAKKDCYQWALPIPMNAKMILKARAGSGPVSAQVFKKKKF